MSREGDCSVLPFEGLRVIDLSPTRVGQQASQLFADFGADVVTVEPPGGAMTRRQPAFPFWARGTRSIELDLGVEDDARIVRDLARTADVLIESSRPGALDRHDLAFATLAAANPRLVYTSITGFGRLGPYADVPAHEGLVMAKLGVFRVFRRMSPTPDVPPFVTVPFAAFPASQLAIHGTLAALHERHHSGVGQHVDVNLAQSFLALDTWAWIEHVIARRWPDAFHSADAFDAEGRPSSPVMFKLLVALTSDGSWLQFAATADRLFQAKMGALGLDWMFADERWKGVPALEDPDLRLELWTRMLEAANSKSLAEWEDVFDADPNVFAEHYREGVEILSHPQLLHDEMIVELDDVERGTVRQPGPIVKAGATPADTSRSAPRLDEHRDEIIAEAAAAAAAAATAPAADVVPPAGGLPLAGVTILELATQFAAPQGPTLLTDLGARVIKIETLAGDQIRIMLPFPEAGGARVMQGKESICIDLATDEGKAIAFELASTADVVLQGYRAGVVVRLGLDDASIRAVNPDVIYVNAPGYGVDGPYGRKPAYAPSIGAAVGIPQTNLGAAAPSGKDFTIDEIRDGARRLSGAGTMANAQADGLAALGVATAILFGLVARDRGCGGQELFTSMVNTGAHAMSAHAVDWPGSVPEPSVDADLRGFHALYRVYDAADGFVFLAATTQREWERLVAAAPFAVLATDGRFGDAAARHDHDHELVAAIASVFATRPADEWERDLLAGQIGCVAVNTDGVEAILQDSPLGRDSGYIADIVHPTFDEMPRIAPLVRFSRSSTQAAAGVLAGQQTDAILGELGRDAAAIADLRARGIVQ
ncbi:MAG: CoA transferase [Ilumatobacteraceae bacterium]